MTAAPDASQLAGDIARRLAATLAANGHAGHPGFLDAEHGVVCQQCGTILGALVPAQDGLDLPMPQNAGVVEARSPMAGQAVVIDPDAPYTPQDLEQMILRTTARIEAGTRFEAEWVEKAEAARLKWELANAEAIINANDQPGGADVRKARALMECEELYREMHEAESLCKAVKGAMHNLRATLSGYQSTLASARAAFGAGGSNGPTPPRKPW